MSKPKIEKNNLIKDTNSDKVFMIFVYTTISLFFLIILLPLIYVVSASFSDSAAVIAGEVWLLPVRPTLRGYEAVFKNAKILSGFINSFIYMIVGTVVNIVMTICCAYPLSRREFKGRSIVSVLLVITMYFSGGMVPTYMVVSKLGIIDSRLAMILPVALSVWNVIICRTSMASSIPDSLYEAASLDGCSPFGFMWRIAVPLSKPVIAVLVLYYAIGHWNTYFNALIYLKSANLMPLQIILREILVLGEVDPTMIVDAKTLAAQQGLTDLLKYAVIVVASVPVMCLYPFVQKYFVKGVMIGAVKG